MHENKINTARVTGRGIPISAKASCEICRAIRNQKLDAAKKLLQNVKEQKQAIAYKRFTSSISHRRGMGPGKYPVKAAGEILSLLESAEANAQFKGLNTNELTIIESRANEGSRPHRYGRQRRRKAKRTHITIVVQEEAPIEKEDSSRARKAEEKKAVEGAAPTEQKTPPKTSQEKSPQKKKEQGDKKE